MSYIVLIVLCILGLGLFVYVYNNGLDQILPGPVRFQSPQMPVSDEIPAGTGSEDEFLLYIEPLPPGIDSKYLGVISEAGARWEEASPDLDFSIVADDDDANVRVQWIKEFGGHPLGQAINRNFVQVGLGDSDCLEKWRPYTYDTVLHIATHEFGHVIGLDHSDDPGDVMYESVSTKYEIDINENDFLPDGSSIFYPVCTKRGSGEYSIEVSSDLPIDVYVVPSKEDYDAMSSDESFSHYPECQGSGTTSYQKRCVIPAGGGIVVSNDEKILIFEGDASFNIKAVEN